MSDATTTTDKPGDPADKAADGAFGGVHQGAHSHRAGYGDDKLERVIAWLRRNPSATLASGEGALLLAEIDRQRKNSEIARSMLTQQIPLLNRWQDENDRLRAAIERVRALHNNNVRHYECSECCFEYPCDTILALDDDA